MAALRAALAALERLAPARLAAKWDNVGLLVDHAERAEGDVFRVLLTNDLTLPVVREALARHQPLCAEIRTSVAVQKATLDGMFRELAGLVRG
jgi:putative NIF3 family GTP cyclohydrolase 1 type 2